MMDGHCKDKQAASRWILQRGDYKRDLHRAGVGYFFTIRFHSSVPKVSFLEKGRDFPTLTPLGRLVEAELRGIKVRHEGRISVEMYAIMEDHLHACLWVEREIKRSPLQILTTMMRFVEKGAQEQFGIVKLWELPGTLYVCYSTAMYQQKKKYTLGNVTRWRLECERPECAHPHLLKHAKLDCQYAWEGYGNEALLDEERFLPCYITHAASDHDVELFTRLAVRLAEEGWVLVGGFVSERERALLKEVQAVVGESRVIHLAATCLKDQKLPAQLASALYRRTFLRLTSAEGQGACERPLCVWQNLWAEAFCGAWRQGVLAHFKALPECSVAQLRNLEAFLNRWQSPQASKYRGPRALP